LVHQNIYLPIIMTPYKLRHPERSRRIPSLIHKTKITIFFFLSSSAWLGIQFESTFLDS